LTFLYIFLKLSCFSVHVDCLVFVLTEIQVGLSFHSFIWIVSVYMQKSCSLCLVSAFDHLLKLPSRNVFILLKCLQSVYGICLVLFFTFSSSVDNGQSRLVSLRICLSNSMVTFSEGSLMFLKFCFNILLCLFISFATSALEALH